MNGRSFSAASGAGSDGKRSVTKKAFVAAVGAACARRVEQNAGIARSMGLAGTNDDLGAKMNYVERALEVADELVAKFADLGRPPGEQFWPRQM